MRWAMENQWTPDQERGQDSTLEARAIPKPGRCARRSTQARKFQQGVRVCVIGRHDFRVGSSWCWGVGARRWSTDSANGLMCVSLMVVVLRCVKRDGHFTSSVVSANESRCLHLYFHHIGNGLHSVSKAKQVGEIRRDELEATANGPLSRWKTSGCS